ncbi:MAG: hypothetical protein IKO49_08340 [Bacilli bacterium]|nr:hypothetical protein [Bacilli bacterium]
MRESIGSIPVLAFVMFFIAAISGYLAFTINYSKAFKVRSKIIDIVQSNENEIENLQGGVVTGTTLQTTLHDYIQEVGYGRSQEMISKYCGSDSTKGFKEFQNQGWCYKIVNVSEKDDEIARTYVKVRTFVSIDVPVINRILPNIRYFVLEGSTKTVKKVR